ncbi:preprotein translocase subunit SecG [Hyphomicrobium sp.]|uniref:preprotein translocase subunit SecG n=1 Tax=Hyphomicrobium sp. TaxID=82 RepID=UPI002FDDA343
MITVLLVIHIMVAAALVAVVLWQRSEGGALGIGGSGGGAGGFLTGRGTANLLTRTTAVLAACFFLTSILLTIASKRPGPVGSAFDAPVSAPAPGQAQPASPAAPAGDGAPRGGILDKLR